MNKTFIAFADFVFYVFLIIIGAGIIIHFTSSNLCLYLCGIVVAVGYCFSAIQDLRDKDEIPPCY